MNGFKPSGAVPLADPETGVAVRLRSVGRDRPCRVSGEPQLLPLDGLISGKLSIYARCGIRRILDLADVVELIKANGLPRDYPVAPEVEDLYLALWDELHKTAS